MNTAELDLAEIEKLGVMEKGKEEDEALKQKAVTYVMYEELTDFDKDHIFHLDFNKFVNSVLPDKMRDPEEWYL